MNRVFVKPNRQIPAPAQRFVVIFPIRDAVLGRQKLVPAIGIELVGHSYAILFLRTRALSTSADRCNKVDEVVIAIRGEKFWLWRAIDTKGDVLDFLVQKHRNAKAANRFLRRLVYRYGEPRVVVTDKLRSYIKPFKTVAPDADHRAHKGLNNRIEGSYRPTRKREKIMGKFKSPRQAQRFLETHDQLSTIFRPHRYRLTAISYRHARTDANDLWNSYALEMTV